MHRNSNIVLRTGSHEKFSEKSVLRVANADSNDVASKCFR